MAFATLTGALKSLIEGAAIGVTQVYKDAPPPNVTGIVVKKPYCTVQENIALTPDSVEDGGPAQGGETYVTELVQLDLWMDWRDAQGKPLESRTLPRLLHRLLDGALLDQAPTRVYGVRVRSRLRVVERDNNIVHVPYTLAIRRAL